MNHRGSRNLTDNIIRGSYYPENPESNSMAFHKRIDWVLRGNAGIFYLGGERALPERETAEIMEHLRRAIGDFLQRPRVERQPVIITSIE